MTPLWQQLAWLAFAMVTPILVIVAGDLFGRWRRNRRNDDGYDTIPSRNEKLPVPGPAAGLPGQVPRAAAPAPGHGDFNRWEQEMRQS